MFKNQPKCLIQFLILCRIFRLETLARKFKYLKENIFGTKI